jgi:hypothetical protein
MVFLDKSISDFIDCVETDDRGQTISCLAHNFASRRPRSHRKRNIMKTFSTLTILFAAVPTMARPNMRSLYRVDAGEAAADEKIYSE